MYIQSISPIGQVKNTPEIEEKVILLSQEWNSNFKKNYNWLDNLKLKYSISIITSFLLYALDELIIIANNTNLLGSDKKATVLSGLERIYDCVVEEALPIWLKPFAKQIKYYVIYILLSIMIDWIVKKYKNGIWNKTGG